jgi:protein subunit release factor A
MLEKELKELDQTLQKHVKVSDVPEHWKHNADLLKIEVDEEGADAIANELDDIEATWKEIEHSQPV